MHKFRFINRHLVLVIPGIVIVSLFVGMMVFKNYIDLRDALVKSEQNNLKTIAENAAKTIETYISNQQKSLFLLVNENPTSVFPDYLEFYYNVEKSRINGVEFYNSSGDLQGFFPTNYNRPKSNEDLEECKNEERPVIGKVQFQNNEPFLMISQPVFKNGIFTGIIRSQLNIDYIYKQFIQPVKVHEKGYASVKSRELYFIMHPVRTQIGKHVITERTSRFPDYNWDDFIDLMNFQTKGGSGSAIYHSVWVTEKEPVRVKKYNGYASAKVGSSFWIVTVSSDYNDVVGVIKNNYYSTLALSFGLALLLILILVYLSYIRGESRKLEIENRLMNELKILNRELEEDIEKRESLETALKASREKYKALFGSGSDCVFVISLEEDQYKKIEEVNDKVVNQLGYTKAEICSLTFDAISEGNINLYDSLFYEKQNQNENIFFETVLYKKDKTSVPVEINARFFELGSSRSLIMFSRDITERKLSELAMKRSEQRFLEIMNSISSSRTFSSGDDKRTIAAKLESMNMELEKLFKHELEENRHKEALMVSQSRYAAMGEMINNIAHQWRQPLNVLSLIISNIKDISCDGSDTDLNEIVLLTDKSNRIIKQMSETIDDFRNFFKPNQERVLFNLADVIQSTYELCSERMKHHQINFKMNIKDDIKIYGISNHLSQVFLNLFNNSIDALILSSDSEKTISISVEKQDGISLYIKDTGPGIPAESVPHIFDPYYTTKEEDGTGIGLYMSRIILEKNFMGSIDLVDTCKGSCFIIHLPGGDSNHA